MQTFRPLQHNSYQTKAVSTGKQETFINVWRQVSDLQHNIVFFAREVMWRLPLRNTTETPESEWEALFLSQSSHRVLVPSGVVLYFLKKHLTWCALPAFIKNATDRT